jgi:hypothetical protein
VTELRVETYEIPAADLGPENPLPVFRDQKVNLEFSLNPNIPEEDRRYLGWQTGNRVLPHRMQDGYNRNKQPRKFKALVLENEYLRATVLPELGGRLVSLFHKPQNRELLDRNPVFQPANLLCVMRGSAEVSSGTRLTSAITILPALPYSPQS